MPTRTQRGARYREDTQCFGSLTACYNIEREASKQRESYRRLFLHDHNRLSVCWCAAPAAANIIVTVKTAAGGRTGEKEILFTAVGVGGGDQERPGR